MKKCPYCGYENVDQVISCKRCSAGIPHVIPEAEHKAEPAVSQDTKSYVVNKRKIRSEHYGA